MRNLLRRDGADRASSGGSASARARGDGWALTRVVDHVTFAGSRMTAWYVAEPVTWSFRSVAEGEALIRDQAAVFADLVGTTIYGRVTSRPYQVSAWARAHYENAPAPQVGFAEMVDRDQVHMAASAQADKLVFYGVDLGERSTLTAAVGRVVTGAAEREREALARRLGDVDRVLAGPGVAARPASPADMEWLLARSFALGCPVPAPDPHADPRPVLDGDDLDEWVSTVAWDAPPLAASTRVTTSINDTQVTRHVVVLSLARLGELAIPEEHEPWMATTDTLGFPVEWAWRVIPRHPDEVSKEMSKIGNRIDAQVDHWAIDHGKRPPKQLARQADARAQVEDEQRRGFTHYSTRTKGWYRLAVSGSTEEQALERAAAVVEAYKPAVRWVRDLGQYHLAREFVPGEPLSSSAHCRHFPVTKVAAGVPAVTAEVGDRRGFHIGETAGLAARAVCFDPWYLPEVMEASGVVPILGVQGSGKSALMGLLCYKSALSGARGVAMDPAGRMHRVLALPELAPISRRVDVLGGRPGSLNPYAAVPEPNQALIWVDATSADDFRERYGLEHAAARQTRRDLAVMTLRWSLPIELNRDPDVLTRLRSAVSDAPAEPASTLWAPIHWLSKGDELAVMVARQLVDASERELGRLFYPARNRPVELDMRDGARFTVFNLKGLVKPDDTVELADYSPEELLYRPIMSLAAWTSLQLIYRGDPHERKFFGLDEAQEVTEVSGAGRTLVHKLRTDSRKNNNAVFLVSQHARVVADAANFIGAVLVGRTQSEDAQEAALRLLGKPVGRGYEQILANLSARPRRASDQLPYREFIYRDGLGGTDGGGGIEKIRVTMAHHPALFEALDTTPRPANRASITTRGPVPSLDLQDDVPDLDIDHVAPDVLGDVGGPAATTKGGAA